VVLQSSESYVPIEELVELRDKLIAWGAITEQSANKLPGMKKAAEHALGRMLRQDAMHYAGFNTDDYAEIRDKWVAAGIVTVDEANHFPRVREIAEDDLFNAASAVNSHPDTIESLKKHWIDVGILTKKEADKLIAEGRAEREQYLHSPERA
jgi:hypothetical protein